MSHPVLGRKTDAASSHISHDIRSISNKIKVKRKDTIVVVQKKKQSTHQSPTFAIREWCPALQTIESSSMKKVIPPSTAAINFPEFSSKRHRLMQLAFDPMRGRSCFGSASASDKFEQHIDKLESMLPENIIEHSVVFGKRAQSKMPFMLARNLEREQEEIDELKKELAEDPQKIHWTRLIAKIDANTNMNIMIEDLISAKKRAMRLKHKLMQLIKRVIFLTQVRAMKCRLEEYNQRHMRRQRHEGSKTDTQRMTSVRSRKLKEFMEFWNTLSVVDSLGEGIDDTQKRRIAKEWLGEFYEESSVWKLFSIFELNELFTKIPFEIRYFQYGTPIFHKDDEGKNLYTILNGNVSLWIPVQENDSKATKKHQIIAREWENILVLRTFTSFGELGLFPNGTGVRNATTIARNQCVLLIVDKATYLQHIHERVINSRMQSTRMYRHLKRKSSKANLERLAILGSIAIEQKCERLRVIIPDRIHSYRRNAIKYDLFSVYVIKQGTVALCIARSRCDEQTIKKGYAKKCTEFSSFLELGPGSIIDSRTLYEHGLHSAKRRKNTRKEPAFIVHNEAEQRVYDSIYYLARTKVVLQQFKLNSFLDVGQFNFDSLFDISRLELSFILQHNSAASNDALVTSSSNPTRTSVTKLDYKRRHDPSILRSKLFNKTPLQLYKGRHRYTQGCDSQKEIPATIEDEPIQNDLEDDAANTNQTRKAPAGNTKNIAELARIPLLSDPLPPPLVVRIATEEELPPAFRR